MQICVPIDAEYVLSRDLGTHCPPIPDDLGATLPYAVATRLPGTRTSLVVDNHPVSVDVYAADEAQAMEAASELLAKACALPTTPGTSIQWLAASVDALPYNNPDPRRPDLARATFEVLLTCRAEVRDI